MHDASPDGGHERDHLEAAGRVGTLVTRVREVATARTGVAPGRRDLGELAAVLAASGITAHLDSPTGAVAVAGAGVDSPAGALLLGTRRVRPRAAVVVMLATVLARRRR